MANSHDNPESVQSTGNDKFSTMEIRRYRRLIEISQELNSTVDLRTLLRHIVSAAKELTHTAASSILLSDSMTGELRFEIASNMKPHEMENIVVPLEGSIAGWIFTHGEPRVIEDTAQEQGHYKQVGDAIEFRTRNLLGVPMRAHTKVVGVLEAVNKHDGESFNAEDIQTLTILASQAAIAIENARLFQQSDFIAEMVHELRTPLAALKASTVLLRRPELGQDKRDDIILTMQGETERLIRMTSDFLDVARLESGRTQLEVSPFALHKLLTECIEVVLPQATEKRIEVGADDDSYVVEGDRGKIKQVLLNLLTNAIKYNREDGHIHIHTHVHKDATPHEHPFVEIAVADTGYGISKENQTNLFQKFYRVADTAGYTTGTGLGLAIAKHIIEAHGGSVWVESKIDVGSTFFITVPLTE